MRNYISLYTTLCTQAVILCYEAFFFSTRTLGMLRNQFLDLMSTAVLNILILSLDFKCKSIILRPITMDMP